MLADVLALSVEHAGMDGFLGMMGSPIKKPKLGEGVSVKTIPSHVPFPLRKWHVRWDGFEQLRNH